MDMSPLQLSVYWRLSLVFFFNSFLFFLDIFTAAVAAETCRHDNGTGTLASGRATLPPYADGNQSGPGEAPEGDADWRTGSRERDVSEDDISERFAGNMYVLYTINPLYR